MIAADHDLGFLLEVTLRLQDDESGPREASCDLDAVVVTSERPNASDQHTVVLDQLQTSGFLVVKERTPWREPRVSRADRERCDASLASREPTVRILDIDQQSPEALLLIDDSLSKLGEQDSQAAELVKLRYFAGFSIDEIAELTGMSRSSAYGHWEYAKAWMRCQLGEDTSSDS